MRQLRLWKFELHINSWPLQPHRKTSSRWRRWDNHYCRSSRQDRDDSIQKVYSRLITHIHWSEEALRPKETLQDHSQKHRAEQRLHHRHITNTRRRESPTTTCGATRTTPQLSSLAKQWAIPKICFLTIWRKRSGGTSSKTRASTNKMEVDPRPLLHRLSIQTHSKTDEHGSKSPRIKR